jgi:CRISPR type I-E-associated protein CasB/Cse2
MNDAARSEKLLNAILAWHAELFPRASDTTDLPDWRGDPGARARLRRCNNVFDALLVPETHELIRRGHAWADGQGFADARLAVLAMTLPRLLPGKGPPFARLLGAYDGRSPDRDKGERPRLSPARFAAMMRAAEQGDLNAFARALRRALRALNLKSETAAQMDVRRFAGDILFMSDAVRQRWAFDYWHTNRAAAGQDADPKLETMP